MNKWIVTVESNCADSGKEQEFNEWYNNIHLPDMLELPEVLRVTRYENTNPSEGEAKYLTVYEVETNDLEKALNNAGKLAEQKAKQGRMSDLFQATRQGHFKQIFSLER